MTLLDGSKVALPPDRAAQVILRLPFTASQFTQGVSGNVKGNPSGKKQVETKPTPPANRDIKAKDARSTVGQVAAKANTSIHKARQHGLKRVGRPANVLP